MTSGDPRVKLDIKAMTPAEEKQRWQAIEEEASLPRLSFFNMLSKTTRCLQLYLLIATLSATCQGMSNNSQSGHVTPKIPGNMFHMKKNVYPSYLIYDNDGKEKNETFPVKKKMQPAQENSLEKELSENKTKPSKILTLIPPIKNLAKYSSIKKDSSILKNTTPETKLKLLSSKEPVSTTESPVEVTQNVRMNELKLGTTKPTSKSTAKKKGGIATVKAKQNDPKRKDKPVPFPKEEMIFSQIKNPFQPNSTIEQEVKVINKPELPGSLNHIIRHIHQHMFNHFDDNFGHGGMHHHDANHHEGIIHHDISLHHGGGFHHGHGHHHGGHLYVDHSLQHWPWHMSIQEEHSHGWHHLCHGAMVGHHSVLTNAECVYHKPLPSLRVVRHNLIDKVITLDNSSFITARIIHPKYKDYVHHHHPHDHGHHVGHHNLALLHLHHGMGVRPIGLHYHGHHHGHHHGHGHGHGHGHCSTAHHNSVQFITNEECDYHFGDEHIGSSHVCAYGLPCDIHHHHGSPLVCSHHGHGPYLVGLSSYQHSCGHHHPTVYERIAPHTDWITSHIK